MATEIIPTRHECYEELTRLKLLYNEEHERADRAQMALDAMAKTLMDKEQELNQAIAAEREACAKVIDNEIAEIEAMFYSERYRWEDDIPYLKQLAAKIRARSEGGEGREMADMKAGRELDVLVAEQVMQRTVYIHTPLLSSTPTHYYQTGASHPADKGLVAAEVPHFSTDLHAAFEVLDRMRLLGFQWELRAGHDDVGFAARCVFTKGASSWSIPADNIPLAICLAALTAIREAVSGDKNQ